MDKILQEVKKYPPKMDKGNDVDFYIANRNWKENLPHPITCVEDCKEFWEMCYGINFNDMNRFCIKENLVDPNKEVPNDKGAVTIELDYPFSTSFLMKFVRVETRRQLCLAVYDAYHYLYGLEDDRFHSAKNLANKEDIRNLIEKCEDQEDKGFVWGHELTDLIVHNANYNSKRHLYTVVMSS